jgi:hypothetical protein
MQRKIYPCMIGTALPSVTTKSASTMQNCPACAILQFLRSVPGKLYDLLARIVLVTAAALGKRAIPPLAMWEKSGGVKHGAEVGRKGEPVAMMDAASDCSMRHVHIHILETCSVVAAQLARTERLTGTLLHRWPLRSLNNCRPGGLFHAKCARALRATLSHVFPPGPPTKNTNWHFIRSVGLFSLLLVCSVR